MNESRTQERVMQIRDLVWSKKNIARPKERHKPRRNSITSSRQFTLSSIPLGETHRLFVRRTSYPRTSLGHPGPFYKRGKSCLGAAVYVSVSPTYQINEAVKRNRKRFPNDFMFLLATNEAESLTSQFAISNKARGGRRTREMTSLYDLN